MYSDIQPSWEDVERYTRGSQQFIRGLSTATFRYNSVVPNIGRPGPGIHSELIIRTGCTSGLVLSEVVRMETGQRGISDELLYNMHVLTGEARQNTILDLLSPAQGSEVPSTANQEVVPAYDPIPTAAEFVGMTLGDKLYGDPPPLLSGLASLRVAADEFHDGAYDLIFIQAQPAAETVLEWAQLYVPPPGE